MSTTTQELPAVLQNISQLLRTEDDLDKVESLKEQLIKEKSSLDIQLRSKSTAELESTIENINLLSVCQEDVRGLKDDISKINKIAGDSFGSIKRYELINKITKVHEIFDQSTDIVEKISSFNQDLDEIDQLIDAEDYENVDIDYEVPNLLLIHYKLNKLRDFQERLLELGEHSNEDSKFIVKKVITKIYDVIKKFDTLLENIIVGLVESVKITNNSLVIRLAKIIDFEEREDLKIESVKEVLTQKNVKGSSNRGLFDQIINGTIQGRIQQRNYKKFFLTKIEESIQEIFQNCWETYQQKDNMFEILDNLDWVFHDLMSIKLDMSKLMPSRWDIFKVYYDLYYKELNILINRLIESEPETLIILEILDFDNKFKDIMVEEFGFSKQENKTIIGEKEKEKLLSDYLSLIILKMNEWMTNLSKTEQDVFKLRIQAPDVDSENLYALEGTKIVFQMFTQQCDVASGSGQGKILAGVVEEFGKLLITRQARWSGLIKTEVQKLLTINHKEPSSGKNSSTTEETEEDTVPPGLIEYLIALANDQMRGADYTEAISNKYGGMVSKKYSTMIHDSLEQVIDGFANLAKQSCDALIVIIFDDLKVALDEIFSKNWYNSNYSQQISDTLYEYLGDLKQSTNSYLFEILSEEIVEETILRYLGNLNKDSLKLKNSHDKFVNTVKADFEIFYKLFINFVDQSIIDDKFRIIEDFMDLSSEQDDDQVVQLWLNTVSKFNDINIDFLNLILKARKDTGSSDSKAILAKAKSEQDLYLQEHQYELTPSFMNRFIISKKLKK
ncbi:Exocyst complex component [Wickerhamomyces ciferrii]|uniref:Exocyst complex component n=1 Tax=Wickerhamomyces ciferrii (strain ATCC 14091 / BCRC 22168 / CBS 111 / JCM 3599 / NBRC 0793 / NRRL Y-1031 F-60-10) TaxID=1206466 RepID=K0KR39_WICCF|nr:Exocyst complex component [Wickerhamomyces ciferrii]CCH43753.1 Exocyst complex component [Wickerhamomyces ciferrii]